MLRSDAIANCQSLKQFGVHVAGQPYQRSMILRIRMVAASPGMGSGVDGLGYGNVLTGDYFL